jgi:hypothetical protein
MSTKEIKVRLKETDTIMPEENPSPYMPIRTDTLIPIHIAKLVAEKKKVLIAPLFTMKIRKIALSKLMRKMKITYKE